MIEISSYCVVCGDRYTIDELGQKTCSRLCEELLKTGTTGRKCVNCGVIFQRKRGSRRITCSEKCRRERQKKKRK